MYLRDCTLHTIRFMSELCIFESYLKSQKISFKNGFP